jgi:hypothetical protein
MKRALAICIMAVMAVAALAYAGPTWGNASPQVTQGGMLPLDQRHWAVPGLAGFQPAHLLVSGRLPGIPGVGLFWPPLARQESVHGARLRVSFL